MSKVASRRFVLGCSLAVLVLLLLLHLVVYGPPSGTTDTGSGVLGAHDVTGRTALVSSTWPFTIQGHATEPISPGVRAPLDLKLTNPYAFPLTVTDLRVRVRKVSAPNADNDHPCTIRDFAVDQASSDHKVSVAAGATSTLTDLGIPTANQPNIGMLNSSGNQDGCKGASLTLAYTASGTLQN
jgi:hypothetical protein